MKQQILVEKPNSILEVVPQDFFIELNTTHDEYLKCKNYYEVYYAIAKYYRPKSILEIGVRYGYSLASMICGYPDVEKVVGIDCNDYVNDSLQIAENNLKKYISSKILYTFLNQNSHTITKLNDTYDLVHIDGDHSYEGKLQDLNLILNQCKTVIVDDYYFLQDVQNATNTWIEQNKSIIRDYFVIDSFRGTMIIEF